MATEIKKTDRKEKTRIDRMFWFYVGYIMALENNGLDKTKDAIEKKIDANKYGHCYQI